MYDDNDFLKRLWNPHSSGILFRLNSITIYIYIITLVKEMNMNAYKFAQQIKC